MSQIKNIDDLRMHAIKALERLYTDKIDTDEAGVIGKLCESAVSTIKIQLEHGKMLGYVPNIPFLGNPEKDGRPMISNEKKELLPPPKQKKTKSGE